MNSFDYIKANFLFFSFVALYHLWTSSKRKYHIDLPMWIARLAATESIELWNVAFIGPDAAEIRKEKGDPETLVLYF